MESPEADVILARYCIMIFVASVFPEPLSPLMMMDWLDALAFLLRTSSLVSASASKCPLTYVHAHKTIGYVANAESCWICFLMVSAQSFVGSVHKANRSTVTS